MRVATPSNHRKVVLFIVTDLYTNASYKVLALKTL